MRLKLTALTLKSADPGRASAKPMGPLHFLVRGCGNLPNVNYRPLLNSLAISARSIAKPKNTAYWALLIVSAKDLLGSSFSKSANLILSVLFSVDITKYLMFKDSDFAHSLGVIEWYFFLY